MTVQLSALRVSAEMDASKFVAGARQVEGASGQAGRAVSGLGVSVQQSDMKISQSGDVLARLSRQYVEGYASAQRMHQAVNSLSRGIDAGKISMTQAEPILEGIFRKYGQLASGASFAAKGQLEFAAAIDQTTAKMQTQQAVQARMPLASNDNLNGNRFRRQNLTYQAFDVAQGIGLSGGDPRMLSMIAMQQGPQILQLYAGQGGINALLKDAGSLAAAVATRMGPIAVVAGLGAMAISEMRGELEKSEGRAVTFGETFMAVMKVVASDIGSLVKPAIDAIAPGFETAYDAIGAGAKRVGNEIINSFHAAYVDVQYVWEQFPNMIGTVVISGLNAVVGGVEDMLNSVTDGIDAWIAAINSKLTSIMGPGNKIQPIGRIDFGPDLPNPYFNPLQNGTEERNRRIREIMGSDPLGSYYNSVRSRAGDFLSDATGTGGDKWDGLRKVDRNRLKEMEDAAKKIEDAFKGIEQVGMSAIDKIVDSATNGFKDIGDVMKSVANDIMKELLELAVKNPLKNLIYGAGLPTLETVGGGGGFLGTLFGMRPRSAASPMAGGGDAWAGLRMASNDNYMPGAVTRAPLPNISATGNIADYIRQAAIARGIDPNIALRVARSEGGLKDPFRQGESMLSYGREESYGPFQLHMRQGGVGTRALKAGIDPRTNWRGGVDYALDEAANKGWGQWFGAAKAGIGNRDGLEGARALGQFTKVTQEATKSVGTLASGFGEVGNGLAQAGKSLTSGGGGGSGGGLAGFLKSLFGGFNFNLSPLANASFFSSGGAMTGLWADGGYTGPGGKWEVAGTVHRGEVVFSQDDIRRNGGLASVEAMRRGAANGNSRPVNVSIQTINNSSAKVETREEDDGNGGRRIVQIISDQVAAAMNTRGTKLSREMRARGAAEARIKR